MVGAYMLIEQLKADTLVSGHLNIVGSIKLSNSGSKSNGSICTLHNCCVSSSWTFKNHNLSNSFMGPTA